jgi:FkbM family methyltransferase
MLERVVKRIVPQAVWDRAVRAWWRVGRTAGRVRQEVGAIGVPAFVHLAMARRVRRKGAVRTVRLAGYQHPVYYREGTTDPWVIDQVFARQEYGCVAAEPDVRYILDCGGNIGCTTFYLLSRYPQARAVLVEPDPGNLAMCRRTLAPFGDRVVYVEAGVWPESTPLVVERGAYRDGGEWSFQVRPTRPGEKADFVAKTVPELMAAGGFPRIDLLKMDIEAAEAEVFKPGCEAWLNLTRTLVIELHGPECEQAVARATSRYQYEPDHAGELTVFRNLSPR